MALDLRSLLNDLYSRDLSRKIHGTFAAARRRGPMILGGIPYGYMRDPEDAHHLVPDPQVACHVREMFRMSARGLSNAKIADYLNDAGAPTAGRVKYARAGMEPTSRDSGRWRARNVNRMLANPVYKGTLVMSRWSQKLYMKKPHAKNDPGEWVVVEGAHEPLVSLAACSGSARSAWRSAARRSPPRPACARPSRTGFRARSAAACAAPACTSAAGCRTACCGAPSTAAATRTEAKGAGATAWPQAWWRLFPWT